MAGAKRVREDLLQVPPAGPHTPAAGAPRRGERGWGPMSDSNLVSTLADPGSRSPRAQLFEAVEAKLTQHHEAVLAELAKERAVAGQFRLESERLAAKRHADQMEKLDMLLKLRPSMNPQDLPSLSGDRSGLDGHSGAGSSVGGDSGNKSTPGGGVCAPPAPAGAGVTKGDGFEDGDDHGHDQDGSFSKFDGSPVRVAPGASRPSSSNGMGAGLDDEQLVIGGGGDGALAPHLGFLGVHGVNSRCRSSTHDALFEVRERFMQKDVRPPSIRTVPTPSERDSFSPT